MGKDHQVSLVLHSTIPLLAIWALSLGIVGEVKKNMQELQDGEVQTIVTCHKEERHTRISGDAVDRQKIRDAISTCIDIFDGEKHPTASLVNIFSGQVVDDKTVNVDDAIKVGTDQWLVFEKQWPDGFHEKISNYVSIYKAED